MKILIVLTIAAFLMGTGCEVTPYRHIITTDAGEEIGLRCALVGGIPVACAFFHETKIEVPFEVLVEVVVEKVVEVEKIKIVEVETIVEIMTTKYINNDINVDEFVQSVISALPAGTTRDNYNYPEVVSAVEETLVTYTPTQTTQITTVREPTDTDVPVSAPVEPTIPKPTDTDVPVSVPVVPDVPSPPVTNPVSEPIVVDDNPIAIRVEGGNSDALDGDSIHLTIRTGKHDPFSCEGNHLNTTAYQNNEARGHQHWAACQVGDDIVVFLKDHPALTCGVGPNTHELEIEGLEERVIVEEDCQED